MQKDTLFLKLYSGGKTAQKLKSIRAKALRPAAFSTAEGAVWTGAHDYYNQNIDINLGNQENIDWGQVAKSSGGLVLPEAFTWLFTWFI